MKPIWIKWYPSIWLHSTARDEMTAAERATFQDFVCLAAISPTPGSFKFSSEQSLSRTLNTPIEIVRSTIKICNDAKRIVVVENEEGFLMTISKWDTYQSFRSVVNDKVENPDLKVNFKTNSSTLISSNLKKTYEVSQIGSAPKDKKEAVNKAHAKNKKNFPDLEEDK